MKRPLKFLKYLSQKEWCCSVLTAKNEAFHPLDPSLVAEIPSGVRMHRVFTLESLFKRDVSPAREDSSREVAKPAAAVNGKSIWYRLYKQVGQQWSIPDSYILWLPFAVARGHKVCRKEKVDVILATGPSFTNFIVGALLKKLLRIPLVLDVRDAWMADPSIRWRNKWAKRMNAHLERFVIHWADRVVTTNPFVTRDFSQRYPDKPAGTFDTILNGYDLEDFRLVSECARFDEFTIVHTGRLYAERTPKFFLQALQLALRAKPQMRDRTKVLFVGSCETYLDGKRIEDYVREYGLEGVVQVVGTVSRGKSLEYQLKAHLLLLLIGIVPAKTALTYGISGKLFDYAACNRPILTLANEGATRELIVTHGLGDIFFHEDASSISKFLVRSFEQYASGCQAQGPGSKAVGQFDFKCMSEKLAHHLEKLVNDKGQLGSPESSIVACAR